MKRRMEGKEKTNNIHFKLEEKGKKTGDRKSKRIKKRKGRDREDKMG